jgi:putative membrane protein
MTELTREPPSASAFSDRTFGLVTAALTVVVTSFLVWLVYFNSGEPEHSAAGSSVLPKVSATLNGISAMALAAALVAVKRRQYRWHAGLMLFAVVTSGAFLANYVYYHLHHGDTPFTGTGWIRPVYFAILISHILLSILVLPLILTSIFLAATRRFPIHRRVSRYTWVIWMYVSVSGVAIYALLHG